MLTQEERAQRNEARKQKYWGPEHNARRRERYASDPSVREELVKKSRVRSTKPLDPAKDPRRFLGRLGEEAVAAHVYPTDAKGGDPTPHLQTPEGQPQLAFRTADLARMLGRGSNLLHRWRSDGKLPEPQHVGLIRSGNSTATFYAHAFVYLPWEIEAILTVLGDHFVETPYYTSKHEETRNKLYAAVEKAREQHGRAGSTRSAA